MIDLRQPREIVGVVGVQRIAAGAAFERQETRPVARGEHDLLRRQVPDDVEQQASRHDDASRLVHVGEELARTDSSMSVAASSTGCSADDASIRTPDRIWTLER